MLITCLMNFLMMVGALVFFNGAAITYRVTYSIITRMFVFPLLLTGTGPTISMAILCHTYSAIGIGCSGALHVPATFLLAQIRQLIICIRTSCAILGQEYLFFMMVSVFEHPGDQPVCGRGISPRFPSVVSLVLRSHLLM